ncbi:unnamed protein product [Mytilus coruscus]|uniref:Uncharacterized protein n=1 Tax=Mytilus coruscus TaxID=42192 RepID=A0A6J8EDV1_MYTCO|nr:unnamed protein product [Mytilus coruscus]
MIIINDDNITESFPTVVSLMTNRVTICTSDDVPSKIGQPHNHLPEQASINSRKILESVRSRCRTELTPIPSIYDEEITKLRDAPWDAQTLETAQKLSTFERKFRQTTSREPFLQADDGDVNKLLIFTTAENLQQLCTADTIYCDGTFYTAPPIGQIPTTNLEPPPNRRTQTNNHLESWHNKLKKRVKTAHPNIIEIINVFKKEQAANEVKKVQYAAGGKMRGKAKKYREVEERFTTLKENLQNGTTDFIQYGDAASYILKLGN